MSRAANITTQLSITVLLLTLCLSASAKAQKCLGYGPIVTLAGTLRSQVFPGPPNYESIKRGDLKETAIILAFAKPACIIGNDPANNEISETGIRGMQLVILKAVHWKTIRRLMGRRAIVTGTLFYWQSGHHHTKVLIDVVNIRGSAR